MIEAYLIIAVVCGIVLLYLGIIHHFWLRDAFNEETLQGPSKDQGTKGTR